MDAGFGWAAKTRFGGPAVACGSAANEAIGMDAEYPGSAWHRLIVLAIAPAGTGFATGTVSYT
ncbi:MAG: hypothetical protein RLY70_4672, partial [Planctomycetota bacterium]